MATFLLANFVAHAATVKTQPGEPVISVLFALVYAFCFPGFGTARGLDAIFRHAITGSSALQKAKKAGALCQVVRTPDWKPQSGDIVRGVRIIKNTSLGGWRTHKVDRTSGLELNDDLQLDDDLELDDVSDARSQVSGRTESRFNYTANGVPDSVETDTPIALEPFLGSPRALYRAHSSRVPSRILHIDGLLNHQMFEPSIHTLSPEGRKVHGICRLPHGFALAPVGIAATVAELDDVQNREESHTITQAKTAVEVSSSYDLAKGLVAVFQTLYASATLYGARGNQIERYGYAAFGLTVAPYLVMSIVNLVSTILTPNYPTTFMVESEIMREAARRDGARFNGAVGMLENEKGTDMVFKIDEQGRCSVQQQRPTSSSTAHGNTATGFEDALEVSRQRWLIDLDPKDNNLMAKRIVLVPARHHYSPPHFAQGYLTIFLRLLVGLISLAINGVLTRFKAGNSTHAQRVWTMTWLAFGILGGALSHTTKDVKDPVDVRQRSVSRIAGPLGVDAGQRSVSRIAGPLGVEVRPVKVSQSYWFFTFVIVYGAVAIGGLVVVCQMLLHYGNCIQIY